MCGIAGIVGELGPERLRALERMSAALAHRGPDAAGIWHDSEAGVALAHRRLAIIDLDAAANQPFVSGDYVLTFNGEIYNYNELRRDLEARGVVLRTQSDTEVLLEAYKAWGPDCLARLNGMFAFAIWDARAGHLFVARDRIGKKPFFYTALNDGAFVFASEPQAMREFPGVDTRVDERALRAFVMLGYSTGEQTCTRGVKRLLPGHAMIVGRGGAICRIWKYWDLIPHFKNKAQISEGDAAAELNRLLDDATGLRMQADVPYGVFLSGGIDSSAVMESMVAKIGPGKVRSFTIGFDENRYDESKIAAATAQHFGTQHHEFMMGLESFDAAAVFSRAGQEPLGDPSFIPLYELSRQARKSVKMALTGDGGDELFAGYPTYIADALHRKIHPVFPFDLKLPEPRKRRSFYFRLHQFMRGLPLDARRAHFSWRVNHGAAFLSGLLREDFSFEDIYALFEPYYEEAQALEPLDQALYVDMKTWLADSVLVKADRASMAHGLELRSPLLDHRIVEFAASLPVSMKLKGWRMKHILRESQRQRLPAFLFGEKKRGFSVPVSEWFRGNLRDEAQAALDVPGLDGVFDRATAERVLAQHISGERDYGLLLYNLVSVVRGFNG